MKNYPNLNKEDDAFVAKLVEDFIKTSELLTQKVKKIKKVKNKKKSDRST